MNKIDTGKINFIDLFAGCGGLNEGFYKEGFNALAHVEIEPKACQSLRTRMIQYGYTDYDKAVLNVDITNKDIVNQIDYTSAAFLTVSQMVPLME